MGKRSGVQPAVLSKQRDPWLDNAKGILIFLVVVGHFAAPMRDQSSVMRYLWYAVYSFHMPAFFMISGYLSQRRVRERDYASVINHLVIPYLIAQVLLFICAYFVPNGLQYASVDSYFSGSQFTFLIPIYQLWYLVAIIWATLLCIWLQPQKHPVLCLTAALLVSMLVSLRGSVEVGKLTKSLTFFPFFMMGNLLNRSALQKIRDSRWLRVGGTFLFVGAMVFIGYALSCNWLLPDFFYMSRCYFTYPDTVLPWQAAVARAGVLLIAPLVSLALLAAAPRSRTLLTRCGERSMMIFVLHTMILMILRALGLYTLMTTPVAKIGLIALMVAVTLLLSSTPVYKLFRPILEPNVDIRRLFNRPSHTPPSDSPQ